MATSAPPSKALYILITSLFYPAVLGVIFYSMLDSFNQPVGGDGLIMLVLGYIGILISFSIDFLYTFAAAQYPALLFASDLLVLFLLTKGYSSLIESISKSGEPRTFLMCYVFIHFIFLFWDLFLIPKEDRKTLVVTYDVTGFIVSGLAFLFFSDSRSMALLALWILTVFYVVVAIKEIVPSLVKDPAQA